jgi:hypothetical protein
LPALALGRSAKRHDAADAGVEAFGNSLDNAALAGRVAAFEDDADLQAFDPHPLLELDQLELKACQLIDVFVFFHRLFRQMAVVKAFPVRFHRGSFPSVAQHFASEFRRIALVLFPVRLLVAHGRLPSPDTPVVDSSHVMTAEADTA